MRVRSFLALSLSCITILLPMQTYASAQEGFKTEEYGASGALDLVNAAEAYAQGYTGRGQTIGILAGLSHLNLRRLCHTIPVTGDPCFEQLADTYFSYWHCENIQ